MNQETQSTEWKRKWRDEFLKSLCGFANAQGGALEIGREDNGTVVGADNAYELLEELPNTVRHALGIVPSVVLRREQCKNIVVVSVEASYTPVSYRGKHYVRSGSTTQELNGNDLDRFILQKMGITWDGIRVPGVKVTDLDTSAFRTFREKAVSSGRLQRSDLELSDEELLDSLALVENGELTRAAILLFHHNPGKYVFGAYIKIGYFETGADLIYQDEFHGSLVTVADDIIESIYRKYFKGIISYEGILRITDYPIPKSAFREAIFNAMVHRDYTSGIPIQIKVFPDCVIIYNDGRLPESWTVESLFEKHRSQPHNPKIAYGFYRAGYIETWGRGIERITEACEAAGKPMPIFSATTTEVAVTFPIDSEYRHNLENNNNDYEINEDKLKGHVNATVDTTVNATVDTTVNATQMKMLELFSENSRITATEISETLNIHVRNVKRYIKDLKDKGMLMRFGSDKDGYWEVTK